jgi:hypothetical protein
MENRPIGFNERQTGATGTAYGAVEDGLRFWAIFLGFSDGEVVLFFDVGHLDYLERCLSRYHFGFTSGRPATASRPSDGAWFCTRKMLL